MIRLFKKDKHSIKLEFDISGAEELSEALQEVLNGREKILRVDEGIKKSLQNSCNKVLKFEINNVQNNLTLLNDLITIEIDKEEAEYGFERIKECIKGASFYPAEFCEINYNNKTLTIYALLIQEVISF